MSFMEKDNKPNIQTGLMFLFIAIIMAIMPITPQPHLFEKLQMLKQGTLERPIDWFDLFIHGAPFLYVIYYFSNLFFQKRKN